MLETFRQFLRLIRLPNLLFIIIAQVLLQYCLVVPMLEVVPGEQAFSHLNFFLLVFSTVLVAAAGYVINDYFDLKIDAINKPERTWIGNRIHRRSAIFLHGALSVAAIGAGIFLAWEAGSWKLALIHPVCTGALWFYSTHYKRQFLTGNLIVALLTALVIVIVPLFQFRLFLPVDVNTEVGIGAQLAADHNLILKSIMVILAMYALFAFLLSMYREVVKDMEDVQGDSTEKCNTIPVALGVRRAKYVALFFVFFLLALLLLFAFLHLKNIIFWALWLRLYMSEPVFLYMLITVMLPLIYSAYRLWKAESQKDFHRVSSLIKAAMFAGIISPALVYLLYRYL